MLIHLCGTQTDILQVSVSNISEIIIICNNKSIMWIYPPLCTSYRLW